MNHWKGVLKDLGLKSTEARLFVLEEFSKDCKPINAEYISKVLKEKEIDTVTIYRTLKTLECKKIIRQIDLRKDSTYYELSDHHHHHMVCEMCGYVEKIGVCNLYSVIQKKLKDSPNFKSVTNHSFEIFGVCKKCFG